MKKYFIAAAGLALTLTLVFVACTKKKDNGAVTPTYKEDANGSGGNPIKNDVTVTGQPPLGGNPATQNSSINTSVGGFAFSNCASTNSLSLKAINGAVDVTINFASPPTTGTYQVSSSVGGNLCTVFVNNAPNQPSGVVWKGTTGSISITTSSTNISAVLNSVGCSQLTFPLPRVTVTGNMSCN